MRSKIKEILCGIISTLILIAGNFLHGWNALLFLFTGVIGYSFTSYFILANQKTHKVTHKFAGIFSLIVLAVGLIPVLFAWQEIRSSAPTRPHLRLSLTLG